MKPETKRDFFWTGWKNRRTILVVSLLVVAFGAVSAKRIAVLGVEAYQAWISPHKGYHCAYAEHHHGTTCSAYGKEVFETHGAAAGLLMLKVRFEQCHEARLKLEGIRKCVPAYKEASGCGDCGEGTSKGCGHFCEGFCDGCGK